MAIVRSDDTSILFRASLFDAANAKITAGAASLRIWHFVPTTGALETYDFNDDTFKTGAVTTATASLTHRQAENSTYNTGVWSYRHSTITNFTKGDKYVFEVTHASLAKTVHGEFQYGDCEGDQRVDIPDGVWDEDIVATHGTASTAGLLLRVLGAAISTRANNSTLEDLLGVPDTAVTDTVCGQVWEETLAGHNIVGSMGEVMNLISASGYPTTTTIADAVWDELTSGHVIAGSAGQRLQALDELLEAGGAGDAAETHDQAMKLDQDALLDSTSTLYDSDSVAGKLDSLTATLATADRQILTSVNIEGSGVHIECAVEQYGIVETAPWTQCSAQIFDESGAIIHSIGVGNFGAINARGFFLFTQDPHSLIAGQTYQIEVTITDGALNTYQNTKLFKIANV